MKKTKLERYHEDYVSQRRVERVVAVTPEAMEIESSASQKGTARRTWITAGSDVAGWCMTNPHDWITVGSVTLPYSINRRGWVAPSGDVIRNPLKAQRLAELMNSKKVAA